MDLQAPTASSVHEALSILVASINLQNGTEYPTDRLESGALEGLGLSDLGQLAEVVNLAQLTLYNEAATRIAALNKRRNALLPIHQLPVELLIDIFVTFLSHSEKGTWNTLWTLARVTSRWWEIVVHTPRLWVAANILDGPGAVATSLRKSASLPLQILCNDSWSSKDAVRTFIDSPRWLNIRLQDANWLSTFGRLLDILPFNNLDTPVRLSLSHIAKLPNHASSAAINLIKSIPSLTHLHCKKYGAVDLDDLIEQLSAPRRASLGHLEWMCPRLRELELFLETHFSGDRSLDPALLSSLSKALRYRRDAAKAAKGGSLLLLPNECKAPEGDLRVTDEFGREYSVESNAFGWRRPTGIALN
ncbi:hypothetical protein FRB99_005981 [Tulasnella sp. 403]|nr:hypothetical protein FRB99_005981 [Tulasnella sp. 403]